MKQQKNIWIGLFIVIVILGAGLYWTQSQKMPTENKDTVAIDLEKSIDFTDITSQELSDMLPNKDFKLVDVHIPEQVHIPKTDYMIPYNDVDALVAALPDKNEKIVLYCRSGAMSAAAATALVERGYTNVFNLAGGMNKWLDEGREFVPKGSISTGDSLGSTAYVALGAGNRVGIVDMNNNTLIDLIPAGNNPHGIAVANNLVFTSSSKMGPKEMLMEPDHDDGESMDMKKMMSLGSNIITVIDTRDKKIIKEINIGGGSHHMASTPDGTKVLATVPSLSGVVIIDTQSLEKIKTIETGKVSNYIAISPSGKNAYVSNKGANTISVIDLKTETVIANIPVGVRPDHVSVNSDGSAVYVSNGGDDTVSIIDTTTNKVVDTVTVGEAPHGLDVTINGEKLYVADSESKTVSVIDLSMREIVNTIQMDEEVAHLEVVPDGKQVLVNSEKAKKIYVIDTATDKIVDSIALEYEPHQTAFQ